MLFLSICWSPDYYPWVHLHPTRGAVDVTIAGLAVLGLGVVSGKAAVVAWGGALILGLQLARAVTLYSVARVRAAGFEMLWADNQRTARMSLGKPEQLFAEVRNRDERAARYVELRALHSPFLNVQLEPSHGEVPAGGRLRVTVTVTADRVGRHGIHGLSLEVRGGPGLYEVPLTFSNPLGVEVLPNAYARVAQPARGGRSRLRGEEGRPGNQAGGSHQLREIRDFTHGDPFRTIAWKASARRGKLMTREFDIEEKDVVWVLLDASVELWCGQAGDSPLDHAVDAAASLVERHLSSGARVGLGVVGHRRLAWELPRKGPSHGARLMAILAFETGLHAADRSGLSALEVSARVLEHLRPLDPQIPDELRATDIDRVAERAGLVLSQRAPFNLPSPPRTENTPPSEHLLRHYLQSFGIAAPGRLQPDRLRTDRVLLEALTELVRCKPRPSLILVLSPAPSGTDNLLLDGIGRLGNRYTEVRWFCTPLDVGLPRSFGTPKEEVVSHAVKLRAQASRREGERKLRSAKIRVMKDRSPPRRLDDFGQPGVHKGDIEES